MFLNDYIKKEILIKLNDILNIKDDNWNNLDPNIKIKIIHHFCNFLNLSNENLNLSNSVFKNIDNITIPLKSNKPKKIIEFSGINKNYNNNLFQEFNKTILDYTFEFRTKYKVNDKKNQIYYTFSNLPKNDYFFILSSINNIVYNFICKYKKFINVNKFYNNIIGSNHQKLITDNNSPKDFNVNQDNNILNIKFSNNIYIKLELFYSSDKITKNIPVKYNIKLFNQL